MENVAENPDILMLAEREKRLYDKDFEWNAWKRGTLLILKKIFGQDNIYYQELLSTDYQYSSWSLRDNSGSDDPVKAACNDIISICISELKFRSEEKDKETLALSLIQEIVTPTLFRTIKEIVSRDNGASNENKDELKRVIEQIPTEQIIELISHVLMSEQENA